MHYHKIISLFIALIVPVFAHVVDLGDDAPRPAALIQSIDLENGVIVYQWLMTDGAPVDSGRSIARFDPRTDTIDPETEEITPAAELTDTEIADAILAPDPDPPVPESVSRRQLKQWLIQEGLYDSVESALAAISDATERAIAQNYWTEADPMHRAHPLVAAIGSTVGLDSAGIDAAFRESSQL